MLKQFLVLLTLTLVVTLCHATTVNILDSIPSGEQAGILAGTSSYDCVPAITNIINTYISSTSDSTNSQPYNVGVRIFFPKGMYTISSNLTIVKDGVTLMGEGTQTSVLYLRGAGKVKVGNNASPMQNVKGFKVFDLAFVNTGSSTGTPMVDLDLVSISQFERVYIKNNNPNVAISNMRLNGYQWLKFDNLNLNGATEHNLIVDSVDAENWNAFVHFDTSMFTLGAAKATQSSNIVFRSAGADNTFNAVAFQMSNCHLSYYPGDGDYTKDTYGIRFDASLPGAVNVNILMTGGAFENQKTMVSVPKAASVDFYSVLFLGNLHGSTAVGYDEYKGRFSFYSCRFVNLDAGITAGGVKNLFGSTIFYNIAGTKLNFNAVSADGTFVGIVLKQSKTVSVAAASTTATITFDNAFERVPINFSFTPTWSTSWSIQSVSTTALTIKFGTAPTTATNIYVEAQSQISLHFTH